MSYNFIKSNDILKISYSIIIGGILSNLIDRILHGVVIDFINLHIKYFNIITFNLADINILIGIIIIFFKKNFKN